MEERSRGGERISAVAELWSPVLKLPFVAGYRSGGQLLAAFFSFYDLSVVFTVHRCTLICSVFLYVGPNTYYLVQ